MVAVAIRQASNQIVVLITVSLLTQTDLKEKWERFYEKDVELRDAIEDT